MVFQSLKTILFIYTFDLRESVTQLINMWKLIYGGDGQSEGSGYQELNVCVHCNM